MALEFSAGSDAGEELPVGFAGVKRGADAVVGEAAEPEGSAFDASGEVVDRFGGAVGEVGAVPVHDRLMPAAEGAAEAAQLGRAVGVGEVVGEFGEVGAGELGEVDVLVS